MITHQFEVTLKQLLKRERRLTERWYKRISGQVPWVEGERELIARLTAKLEAEIGQFWNSDTTDWFAGLPEEL